MAGIDEPFPLHPPGITLRACASGTSCASGIRRAAA